MLLTFLSYNLESRQDGLPVIQTDAPLFHNSIPISLRGKGKQDRVEERNEVYVFIFMCYTLQAFHKCFDWASSAQPSLSEQQEKLEATWRLRLMLHIVCSRLTIMCHICLCVSVAFLGDIALDEEDLRSFKVDRIIDLAERSVQIVNHTDTGNDNRNLRFKELQLEVKVPRLEH